MDPPRQSLGRLYSSMEGRTVSVVYTCARPMTTRPNPDRPRMTPTYGVGDPQYGFEAIEWSWVIERMTEARSYWIVTTRADGRPHVMPVWGVWIDDGFHFVTDAKSLKARNIRRDPRAAVHLESGDEVVILDGSFEEVLPTPEMVSEYERKYDMSLREVS